MENKVEKHWPFQTILWLLSGSPVLCEPKRSPRYPVCPGFSFRRQERMSSVLYMLKMRNSLFEYKVIQLCYKGNKISGLETLF